jgi:hypothetical protein
MPACVLTEAERLYGAHGVAFFTVACDVVDGKKRMRFPARWQLLRAAEARRGVVDEPADAERLEERRGAEGGGERAGGARGAERRASTVRRGARVGGAARKAGGGALADGGGAEALGRGPDGRHEAGAHLVLDGELEHAEPRHRREDARERRAVAARGGERARRAA